MKVSNLFHQLAPIIDRVRLSDHWVVPPGGAPSHRRSRLARETMEPHFRGGHRVGACPIERGQSTTRIAVIDLDSHGGEVDWPSMLAVARALIDGAALMGLVLVPFRSSGGQGIHLYAIWQMPQDARSVRAAMAQVLSMAGLKSGTKGVAAGQAEIFPKQDSVPLDGWGNMFVLPLAGESVALDPDTLAFIEPSDLDFPLSDPVEVLPPPERLPALLAPSAPEVSEVREALAAIDPNDFDYEGWIKILFAVHSGTDGSDEGLALMHEWSARFERYDAEASHAETEKQWSFARSKKAGGITVGTLFGEASKRGYVTPLRRPSIEGLSVIVDEEEGTPPDAPSYPPPVPTRGGMRPTLSNIRQFVEQVDQIRYALAYDEFLATVMASPGNDGQWRPITDEDVTTMRLELERIGFNDVPLEKVRAIVDLVARRNAFDSAKTWLARRPAWDGVPRVEQFLSRYLGAEDRPYTRAVSRYIWTALVGRILSPGCKVDMVPVLVGAQGVGKSTSIMAMVPAPDFYCEVNLGHARDDDQARLLRGKLIGEIAELRGLATRDAESIKAWITRTHEEWTPKYKEHQTRFARRCIFIGTTNDVEFLSDPSGHRRWLPVIVSRGDIPAIERDRDQLYAEAVAIHARGGIQWREAERLARAEHAEYIVADEWDEPVREFLMQTGARVSAREIAAQVLRLELRQVDARVTKRIANALRRIGAVHFRGRDGSGAATWLWARPSTAKVSADDLI